MFTPLTLLLLPRVVFTFIPFPLLFMRSRFDADSHFLLLLNFFLLYDPYLSLLKLLDFHRPLCI